MRYKIDCLFTKYWYATLNTMTSFIEKPNRRRVMIFDVETTGLLPRDRTGIPLTELPHILQISFVIFDTQYWRVVKSVDYHINVPSTIEISPLITELTGITREKCDTAHRYERIARISKGIHVVQYDCRTQYSI